MRCRIRRSFLALALNALAVTSVWAQQVSPAVTDSVQVSGDISSVLGAEDMPNRMNEMWKFIASFLKVRADLPAPMVYVYPFDSKVQPALLTDLQAKDFPGISRETTESGLNHLKGITYPPNLYAADSPYRGRIIQINAANTFPVESGGTYGYGLYVTSHEMVHYALTSLGVDLKYQHCVMAQENDDGDSIMLTVLRHQISKGWANELLSYKNMMATQGYIEEGVNCGREKDMLQQTEGPEAVAAFETKVQELANGFVK